jgi:peroxiredoxin
MHRKFLRLSFVLLLICAWWFDPMPGAAQETPAVGEIFPDVTLPLPNKVEEREYLNIEQGPFHLSQIDSEIVIIQIFSMYCPHCQKEAPNVNALYRAILARPEMKSRVKLVGIGAGNSAYEVNAFRTLYRIPFPLLPDEKFVIHKQVGEVPTPYFFVLWNRPAARTVIYSQVGTLGDPGAFLDMIAEKTVIKAQGGQTSK